MRNRDISLIVIGLFIGAVIGGVIGNLLAWSLPEGVVKDFFLTSLTFDIGSNIGGVFFRFHLFANIFIKSDINWLNLKI